MKELNLDEILHFARRLGVSEPEITKIFRDHGIESIPTNCRASKTPEIGIKDILCPGFIVEFNKNDTKYLGVALYNKTILYFNFKGEIKGYLNIADQDAPYKILRVLAPTDEFYQLSQYNSMPVIWECIKEVKIKKSISDIEKELGLAPGTLEIS